MENTYIKLYRGLIEWEWYSDSKMVHLFIHLLLRANYSNNEWRGNIVLRGQLITGLKSLEKETNISQQSLRTCLEKLKKTKEITIKSTNKFSVITILKYDSYQSFDLPTNKQTNKPITNNQQTTNKQLTTNNKVNNINKDKEEVFLNWIEYRKEIKKSISNDKTLEALIDKFNKEPLDKVKFVVSESISNGWQGLFWDKYNDKPKKQTSNNAPDYQSLRGW